MTKIWKAIVAWLFAPKTVAKITKGFNKTVAELEAHAVSMELSAASLERRIGKLAEARLDAIDERSKALRASANIKNLFG